MNAASKLQSLYTSYHTHLVFYDVHCMFGEFILCFLLQGNVEVCSSVGGSPPDESIAKGKAELLIMSIVSVLRKNFRS